MTPSPVRNSCQRTNLFDRKTSLLSEIVLQSPPHQLRIADDRQGFDAMAIIANANSGMKDIVSDKVIVSNPMIYVIPTADLTNVININFGFGLFHFPHTADCYTAAGTSRSIIYLGRSLMRIQTE